MPKFSIFLDRCLPSLKWLVFLSSRLQNTLFRITLLENEKGTNFPIFDQKPWTNPFGKMPNFRFF